MIYDPVLGVIHHLSDMFCSNCGHESCNCRNIMNISTNYREHKSHTTHKTTQWSQSVVSGPSILQTGPVLPTANVWKTWVISKHGEFMNRQFEKLQLEFSSDTEQPHHPVPLACLDVRELLLHRSHDSASRAHPGSAHLEHQVSASKSLYDHWSGRQSSPGTLELLAANFWWNYKSSWELRSRSSSWEPRFSCGKVGTCFGWNTPWSWCLSRLVSSSHDSGASSDCNAEKYYSQLWCNVEAHDFFKELLAVFAYLLLSILKSDK